MDSAFGTRLYWSPVAVSGLSTIQQEQLHE